MQPERSHAVCGDHAAILTVEDANDLARSLDLSQARQAKTIRISHELRGELVGSGGPFGDSDPASRIFVGPASEFFEPRDSGSKEYLRHHVLRKVDVM